MNKSVEDSSIDQSVESIALAEFRRRAAHHVEGLARHVTQFGSHNAEFRMEFDRQTVLVSVRVE